MSDNGKEFVSKELKDWLAAQECKNIDTPLYSPRSNELTERAVQTLKRSLKFYNKDIGSSLTTYIDKILFSHRNSSNARGDTPAKLLLGKNLRNHVVGIYEVGEKVMYKPTSNHEPKELTYIIRKGRNTSWLHDNNRTILASDGQIAPLPSSNVKLEPQPNIGHDVIQDPVTPKTSNADNLSPVLTEEHTAVTNDRPKRLRTKPRSIKQDSHEATKRGDVVTSSSLAATR